MVALAGCKTMDMLVPPTTAAPTTAQSSPPARTAQPAFDAPPAAGGSTAPLPYSPSPRQTEASRSEAEKRLADDTKNFRSVVFGGFLSNVMTRLAPAALTCYTRYPNNKPAREQCLKVGAVAISLEGVSKGYTAAKLQEAGQNRVRAMESVTADMANDNARLQSMINASEAVLNESQLRLKKLRDDVQAKRMAADQARQESKREQENLDNLTQALNDAKTTRDEYVKTAQNFRGTPAERRNLDAEIAAMTAKVKTLENNVKKLSDALVPFSA